MSLDDAIYALGHIIRTPSLSGPVNLVSGAVTNKEFSRILGRVFRRAAILPAPSIVLKMLLGEMAEELLLASAKVTPKKLIDSGYQFRFPDLENTFRHLYGYFPAGHPLQKTTFEHRTAE